MTFDSFYDDIELTPEEVKAALLEGRKRKYFREKHKQYWEEQQNEINLASVRPRVGSKSSDINHGR